MGYAEIYRRRNAPWRKAIRIAAVCIVMAVLFYFSLQLLDTQSGLMMGGASGR
jgi:hypothetical protein